MSQRAFSLPELLLAIALFAVAILSIVALSLSVLRTDRKTVDTGVAHSVARQVLLRSLEQVRTDQPGGSKVNFWNNNYVTQPFLKGKQNSNGTDFEYSIYAETVVSTSASPVGGAVTGNRLKKVDVIVWWWNSDRATRTGYGKLQISTSRLVSEADR